jgi:hypothetical protein
MAEEKDIRSLNDAPLPGWACVLLGVGFIVAVPGIVIFVRIMGGQ